MRLGLREWCRPDRAREGSETGSATPYPEPGHLKTSPESGEARCLPRVPLQTRAGRARPGAGRHIPDGETRPRLPHRPPPANLSCPPVVSQAHRLPLSGHPRGRTRTAFRSSKPRLCFAALQVPPATRNAAAWSDPHLLKRRWPPPSSEAQALSRTRPDTRLPDSPYPAQAVAYASLPPSSGQGTSQQARAAGDHAPPFLPGCCPGLGRAGEATRRPLPGSHPPMPWPVASSSARRSHLPKLMRLG